MQFAFFLTLLLFAAGFTPLHAQTAGSGNSRPVAKSTERRAKPPIFSDADRKLFTSTPTWLDRPLISWRSATTNTPANQRSGVAPAVDEPSSASEAWPINAEELEDEIKDAAERLGKAKGEGTIVRDTLVELARWFDLAGQLPGEVRWKNLAKSASARFAKLANNAEPGGNAAAQAAESGNALMVELIRSGSASLDESAIATGASWSDLGPLMRRMEMSHRERVSPALASDKEFSAQSEEIAHEGSVVAALARIIQADSYGFSDDSGFAAYSQHLLKAETNLHQAATQGDRAAAQAAWDAAEKACNDCHGDYR